MKAIARRTSRRRLQTKTNRRPRFRTRESADLVASLGHIHRLVMAGMSLESAITSAVLSCPCEEVTTLHALVARGESVDSASRSMIDTFSVRKRLSHRERDAILTLHVLSFAGSFGGRVADHLESLIDILNDRVHLRRERVTQAAGATASMRLLTWIPLACSAWMLLDSSEVRSFLFESTFGWTCLISGIGLNLIGRRWMGRAVAEC